MFQVIKTFKNFSAVTCDMIDQHYEKKMENANLTFQHQQAYDLLWSYLVLTLILG